MTRFASDDFNRANANPIGGNWTTGGSFSALKILSNEVQGSTVADNAAFWNASSFPDDQYSEAAYVGTADDSGPAVRMNAADGYVTFSTGGNHVIARINGGTPTQIGTAVVATGTFAAGDAIRMEVRTVGGNAELKLLKNGTQVGATKVDSSPLASGSAGLYIFDATATHFDNWAGGSIDSNVPTQRSRFPTQALLGRRGRGLKSWLDVKSWWREAFA